MKRIIERLRSHLNSKLISIYLEFCPGQSLAKVSLFACFRRRPFLDSSNEEVRRLGLASSQLEAGRIREPATAPTRMRWRIVTLLAFVAGLTYIDRLNLGILAKYIQEEFQLPTQTMGWILGAFSLGYAWRSEEHTSELQSQFHLVCRLLLEKKNNKDNR